MKKTVLAFALLAPILTLGQAVDHFSNSDSRWSVADTYPNGNQQNPFFVETRTTLYGFEGDTLINGETWLKMYSTQDSLFTDNLNFEAYIQSSNNVILKADVNLDVDTLYDFNIAVGDSVSFVFWGEYSENIPVVEIDSLLINGQYYRQFHFAEPTGPNAFTLFNEKWIEGIGSVHGPLFPNEPDLFSTEIPDALELICSKSGGMDIWLNADYDSCIVNIVLSQENLESNIFNVFPNPFQNEITIESPSLEMKTLTVFNALGQIVHTESWKSDIAKVNVSRLLKGIYFLNIQVNNRFQTIKLVKQD